MSVSFTKYIIENELDSYGASPSSTPDANAYGEVGGVSPQSTGQQSEYDDMGMGISGMEPGMGMGMDDGSRFATTNNKIGRVWELKKIHEKLLSILNMLDYTSTSDFEPLKTEVEESLKLFNIIVMNMPIFEDKIDEIIVEYYDFIKHSLSVYEKLHRKSE